MAGDTEKPESGNDALSKLVKHDIRNQLSNISLSLEQLKYELPDLNEDTTFYLSTITDACMRINELLKKTD